MPVTDAVATALTGLGAPGTEYAHHSVGHCREVGADHIEQARRRATPVVVDVLSRYPAAPPGGGRVGQLLRDLDGALRGRS